MPFYGRRAAIIFIFRRFVHARMPPDAAACRFAA